MISRNTSFFNSDIAAENDSKWKPDYVASTVPKPGYSFDLLVVEVKKSKRQGNGHRVSDLVKLGKMLKQMLTILLEQEIEWPMVVGLLVAGEIASRV